MTYELHNEWLETQDETTKKIIEASYGYKVEELNIKMRKILFLKSKSILSNDDFMKWIHEEE